MARQQNSAALPAYTVDNRKQQRRGKQTNASRPFQTGQRQPGVVKGGGGPENAGAATTMQAGIPFTQTQPSWRWEFDNDFVGPAAPSTKPDVSGTPSNSFRTLGDLYGGRQ